MRKWSLALFLLSGCMVGPNYCPPEVAISDKWNELDEKPKDLVVEWWKLFDDSKLNQLIEKAALCNYSIAAAETKIQEARALKQVAGAKLFPQISAKNDATKYYFSKDGFLSLFDKANLPPVIPQINNVFNALLDVSWELDIFGKTRRTVEALERVMESQIENKNDVLLSVLAEVALNYVDLRSAQKRLDLARKNVWINEIELEITQENKNFGLINQTALNRAENALCEARAKLPELIAKILTSIYSISVLTGSLPETLVEELSIDEPQLIIPEDLALGVRSELLRRRPDIRKAERELAAATSTIGIAVASFFPSFSFGLDAGLQSLHWNDLFDWKSRTWNIGGGVQLPIFEGGKQVGNLHFSEALAIESAQKYRQTVLNAIQEAESSLTEFKNKLKIVKERTEILKTTFDTWSIAKIQNEKGLTNRMEVLNVEKETIQTEELLIQTHSDALNRLITLYKALGGGWEPFLEAVL